MIRSLGQPVTLRFGRCFTTNCILLSRSLQSLSAVFGKEPRKLRTNKPVLSLEEFLFRQRLLSIYRSLIRLIYTTHEKDDLIKFASAEFKINNRETDLNHRKYLLTLGVNRINEMIKMMGLKSKGF